MKKTDIALVVFIAIISVIVAVFAGRIIFGDVYEGTATVKTAELIVPTIVEPSTEIFNENAINSTVQVQINETTNS